MEAATRTGAQLHRSAAQQVEYWAELGRQVARFVDPNTLLEVAAGLARLKVEPTPTPVIDSASVFAAVKASRESGELARAVTTSWPRYQASVTHPGFLERIESDGTIVVGQFTNGVFSPIDEHAQ